MNYSTHWGAGGSIIERERICLRDTGEEGELMWEATDQREDKTYRGATPLIAICRCYVASIYGEEIEIPKELVSTTLP